MIDSVPLIQNANDVQQINASIIAMKKASRELDEKIVKLNSLNSELDKKIALLDSGLNKEIEDRKEAINSLDVASVGGSGKYISAISETDGKISATASDITSSVSSGNSQPVTSGGVADAISAISKLAFVDKTDSNDCVDIVTDNNSGSNVNLYRIANPSSDAHKPPLSPSGYFILGFNRWTNTSYQFFTQIAVNTSNGFTEESNIYIRQGYKSLNTITWFDWRLIQKQDTRFGTFFAAGTYNSGYALLLTVANTDGTGNHEAGFQCVVDMFIGNTITSVLVNVLVRGAGTAVNVKTFTTLIIGGHYDEGYAGRIKATYQVVNNHYVVRLWGVNSDYWQRYNIKLLKVWNLDCMYQGDIFESKVLMPCSHESALTGTEITRYSMNTLS